jgi:hypothetical protein
MKNIMQNFEQIRRHLHTAGFKLTIQEPYMACVELSLSSGSRQQAVFLSELSNEDGRNFLRVNTVIAPAAQVDLQRSLTFNWQSRTGYLAIGELNDTPYLQLCENRPYEGLTAAEIERLILEIGGLGDHMERNLTAGGDLL